MYYLTVLNITRHFQQAVTRLSFGQLEKNVTRTELCQKLVHLRDI